MRHGSHCIQTTFQSLPKEGRREKKSQLFAFLCLMLLCCFGSAPLLERMNNKMDRKHWEKKKKKGTQDRLVCRFDQKHHTSPNILEKA